MIFFAKNTKKCYKTKLFKLFYNADFLHFKETGKSISGLDYVAWKMGPVPADLWQEFKNPKEDFKKLVALVGDEKACQIVAKSSFDDKYFSERELKILEKVAFIFKEANTDTMIESTHLKNHPWDKTIKMKGDGAKIDYTLAFDGENDSLTKEEYQIKLQETQETERFFAP